jgi:sugar phosphate permease
MGCIAAGVGLFSGTTPYLLILFLAFALGATAIGWNGVYVAEVVRLAPAGQAGAATGGCLFFTFIGVVVNPVLFGMAQRASGSYQTAFMAAAAICVTAGIVILLTRKRQPARASQGEF